MKKKNYSYSKPLFFIFSTDIINIYIFFFYFVHFKFYKYLHVIHMNGQQNNYYAWIELS